MSNRNNRLSLIKSGVRYIALLHIAIGCISATTSPVKSVDGKLDENIVSQHHRENELRRRSRPAGCPSDFVYLHSVNGCYKMVTDKLSWEIAGLNCHAIDNRAHLVIINNADEQRNVVENIAKYYSVCGPLGFWIASQLITPRTANSQFVWKIFNGESCPKMTQMTYTHWLAGEPSQTGNGVESCVHAWRDRNYQWSDIWCWEPICSICEIDL